MSKRRVLRRALAPVIALITLTGGLTAALIASAPSAPAVTCGGTALCPIPLDYYAPLDSTNPPDPTLCQSPPTNATPCHIELRGVLYMPGNKRIAGSAKNNPLVIFVHGSTNNNTAPDTSAMATFFTKHNYAFFALHRRGHGDSTGVNLDGVVPDGCTLADCDAYKINNLCRQVFEVKQAILAMKALTNGLGNPIIDPTRIAVLGHSLGAIVTLCANQQNLGQRTVIDIAAASESWDTYDREDGTTDGHSPTISLLNSIVANHVTPPMFLQPHNDCSTVPTDQFSQTVADQNQLYEATLFPDVTVNTTPPYGPPISDCTVAHPNFVFLQHWVDQWGPSVKVWLDRMFVPPPPPVDTGP